MSDLVERLRAEADALDNSFRRNLAVTSTEAVTMRKAAAHIERIEALNAELLKIMSAISSEAKVANDVIALKRDANGQGRIKVATSMHRIAEWSRAALAKSDAFLGKEIG